MDAPGHSVSPLSPAQAAAGYTGAINTPEWRARPAFLQSFEARVLHAPLSQLLLRPCCCRSHRCRPRYCLDPAHV